MLSAFAHADELERIDEELRTSVERLPVLFDLEVPLWDPRRLVARPGELRRTAAAFARLAATATRRHELCTAEWPPPGFDWPRSLRLTLPTASERSYMLYSTMMPGWWRDYLAGSLGRRFRAAPGGLGLGTLAPGIGGRQATLTPQGLRRDLDMAVRIGARSVVLYRLGGLTPEHAAVAKSYAAGV